MVITAGQEMLIISGPITAEDYEWYFVELPNREEDGETMGWVAAVPAGAGSQSDALADPDRAVELSATMRSTRRCWRA